MIKQTVQHLIAFVSASIMMLFFFSTFLGTMVQNLSEGLYADTLELLFGAVVVIIIFMGCTLNLLRK